MTDRPYPIRPRPTDDLRFTFGLTVDVARVLQDHGYPPFSADDLVDLRQVLYRFLYAAETEASSTAPLTPEREAQIRKLMKRVGLRIDGYDEFDALHTLLAELDRLRAELSVVEEVAATAKLAAAEAQQDSDHLAALHAAGVDSWDGYVGPEATR